ncbi:MAG: polysaccharide biosynthesis/export family protein [Bacteroidota bacterium]|nr:polysaccharide biosynthesis/export family protein [Bacteroidota bacterium]
MAKISGPSNPVIKIVKHYNFLALYLVLAICICSCSSYRQNILFRTSPENYQLKSAVVEVEANYVIQKNDFIKVQVFTNKGERIVDPNQELNQNPQIRNTIEPEYLVQNDGLVNLPIVGTVNLAGQTLFEAGKFLEEKYNYYYKDAYVLVNFSNKRVIVLGAPGGQVIPLAHENMNLLEVLALAGGLDNNAKAENIRLIRGDINNPEIFVIDLTTFEGMKSHNLKVLPGDIIYIEPVRRVLTETVRDIAPVLSIVTSLLTLIIVLQQLQSQ